MKYIVYLIIPLVLISLYGGCGGDGNNISEEDQIVLDNLCFLLTSENRCFDSNEGGEMRIVDGMTAEEVISEEQAKQGFVKELEFTEIFSSFRRSFFLPPVREVCSWNDSGLVIKNNIDWDNYRNNCFFTGNFFELPDVDFVNRMALISLKGGQSFGTEIVALLEFEDEIVAVISDRVSDVPSSESGPFGSSIVEVKRKNLPVSFVRAEDICSSFFNFSNSECIAESIVNVCENLHCGSAILLIPGCSALDCSSFTCNGVPGVFTDIELIETNFPIGIHNIDSEENEFGCNLVVE